MVGTVIKVNNNLVLVNGFKQVVIAETGHDDCVSVSDSTQQSAAHAATVDHQVDKEKLAVLHRNGPVGGILTSSSDRRMQMRRYLRVVADDGVQIAVGVDDTFRYARCAAGIHQPGQRVHINFQINWTTFVA